MAESVQTVFWEGGELNLGAAGGKVREAVLAVPMDRLLVKVVKVPSADLDNSVAFAEGILKSMSPYPDEPLAVSVEPLREAEDGRVVLAAALPESSAEDIAGALDGAGVNVTRIDAIPLGRLHSVVPQFAAEGSSPRRRLLLLGEFGYIAAFVYDDDMMVALRAVSADGDIVRELTLLLLEAEESAGPADIAAVVTAGDVAPEGLDTFGPVRSVAAGDPVEGVAARTADPATLNALPESWREVLEETRFKRKMAKGFGVAGGIWILLMAVLFGVPKFYEYKTDRLNDRKAENAVFRKVKAKVDQVRAVKAISNHDQGGLETLRAVVSSLPAEEIELSRWNFKRNEKLTFSGSAAGGASAAILEFKDNLSNLTLSQISGLEEDGETPFFTEVTLPRGINTRAGKSATFDVECSFVSAEGEDE